MSHLLPVQMLLLTSLTELVISHNQIIHLPPM